MLYTALFGCVDSMLPKTLTVGLELGPCAKNGNFHQHQLHLFFPPSLNAVGEGHGCVTKRAFIIVCNILYALDLPRITATVIAMSVILCTGQ